MTPSKKKMMGALALCMATAGPAAAGLVNLSTWTAQGGNGLWQVAPDGQSVVQTVNTAAPTVFFTTANSQGRVLSGKIKVEETGGDDDFIGWVLGFNTGDLNAAGADYLLIDWKQATQVNGNCTGSAGLSVSRVTGPITQQSGWCHNGNVTELQRAATWGGSGWADNVDYDFEISFTATRVQMSVNGVMQFDLTGNFSDGGFGLYGLSQSQVRYSAINEVALPAVGNVPEPASVLLSGLALAALGFAGRRRGAMAVGPAIRR